MFQRIDRRKIEGIGFASDARDKRFGLRIYPQAGIGVGLGVPRQYFGVVFVFLAAGHIDADLAVGHDLIIMKLRREILAGVAVMQFIVITGRGTRAVFIFGKIPQKRVGSVVYPHDVVAAFKTGLQLAFMVNGIEQIGLVGFIPYTGIQNDAVTVRHSGNAYLCRRIGHFIVVSDARIFYETEPWAFACRIALRFETARVLIETDGQAVGDGSQHNPAVFVGCELEFSGFVRLIGMYCFSLSLFLQ